MFSGEGCDKEFDDSWTFEGPEERQGCQLATFVAKLKSQTDHLRPLNATVRCARRPPIEGRVYDHHPGVC